MEPLDLTRRRIDEGDAASESGDEMAVRSHGDDADHLTELESLMTSAVRIPSVYMPVDDVNPSDDVLTIVPDGSFTESAYDGADSFQIERHAFKMGWD
jgi:hypothetical protein